jgi:hypothetical protein
MNGDIVGPVELANCIRLVRHQLEPKPLAEVCADVLEQAASLLRKQQERIEELPTEIVNDLWCYFATEIHNSAMASELFVWAENRGIKITGRAALAEKRDDKCDACGATSYEDCPRDPCEYFARAKEEAKG